MQNLTAPRGTRDILFPESKIYAMLAQEARQAFELYGYREVWTPIFESVELFTRSIGECSQIVEKEMFTFKDAKGRSFALRPEGTAGVVRAYIEHGMDGAGTAKFYYIGPMFRRERPQAGRQRQFTQMGVELFGQPAPEADFEVISLLVYYLERVGIFEKCRLLLNSMGCHDCRPGYIERLSDFLSNVRKKLCPDCQRRSDLNPLRVFDCKVEKCQEVLTEAPATMDNLCEKCRTHFARVTALLDRQGIRYEVDARLVRGFDYYTRTSFEARVSSLGAQDAIGGGGRYDRLVEELGGKPTPAIGFAMGLERLALALEKEGLLPHIENALDVFVAKTSQAVGFNAISILESLRRAGISADSDYQDRSLKAQMRLANKLGAKLCVIVGEEEISRGAAKLRDMRTGDETEVPVERLVDLARELLGSNRERR